MVFGDNQKKLRDLCFIQESDHDQDLGSLFGTDHDLALDGMRPRYRQNLAALDSPLAYVAIYDPSVAAAKSA